MVLAVSRRVKAETRVRSSGRANDGAAAWHMGRSAYPPSDGDNHSSWRARAAHVTKRKGGVAAGSQATRRVSNVITTGRGPQPHLIGRLEYLHHEFVGIDLIVGVTINVEQITRLPVAAIRAVTAVNTWAQRCIHTTPDGFTARQVQGRDQGIDSSGHALC